jgi:AICAR transformylase/IMP cyclohydrolase PurH
LLVTFIGYQLPGSEIITAVALQTANDNGIATAFIGIRHFKH